MGSVENGQDSVRTYVWDSNTLDWVKAVQADVSGTADSVNIASDAVGLARQAQLPTSLGQKAMSASLAVCLSSDQTSIPVASSQSGTWTVQPGNTANTTPWLVAQFSSNRADTFTSAANGTTIDVSTKPTKSYAIAVKGTGASATTWDIRLEGSLDNTNFTQILQHTNTTGDGVVLFSGAVLGPALYIRSRVAAVVLGAASNVVVTILGVQ